MTRDEAIEVFQDHLRLVNYQCNCEICLAVNVAIEAMIELRRKPRFPHGAHTNVEGAK